MLRLPSYLLITLAISNFVHETVMGFLVHSTCALSANFNLSLAKLLLEFYLLLRDVKIKLKKKRARLIKIKENVKH